MKKINCTLILLTIFCLVSNSQTLKTYKGPFTLTGVNDDGTATYTYYEKEDGSRIKNGSFSFIYTGKGNLSGYNFTAKGEFKNDFRNGPWIVTVSLKDFFSDGYYVTGTMTLSNNFKNGHPDGIWKYTATSKKRKGRINYATNQISYEPFMYPENITQTMEFSEGLPIGHFVYKSIMNNEIVDNIEATFDSLGYFHGKFIILENSTYTHTFNYYHGFLLDETVINSKTGKLSDKGRGTLEIDSVKKLYARLNDTIFMMNSGLKCMSNKFGSWSSIRFYDDLAKQISELFSSTWNYDEIGGYKLYPKELYSNTYTRWKMYAPIDRKYYR